MEDLARAVLDSLEKKRHSSEYVAIDGQYSPIIIEDKNYTPISRKDEPGGGEYAEFSFVDGGQTIFFESPSIAIGLLRIGAVFYDGTQRISRTKNEFYIFARKTDEGFLVRTFPATQFDNLEISSGSMKTSAGLDVNATPQSAISLVRRCMELELASQLSNPVIDGTLEAKSDLEMKYLSRLTNAIAVAKTCTFTLNTGESLARRLAKKEGSWFYHPLFENRNSMHDAKTYFAKLHDDSKHVFRLEFSSDIKETSINKIICALRNISNDPIFLGYPYGLVDVDQYVRVSDEEKEYMKIKLSTILGKEYKQLSDEENSINAHSILDNIKF